MKAATEGATFDLYRMRYDEEPQFVATFATRAEADAEKRTREASAGRSMSPSSIYYEIKQRAAVKS